MTADSFRIPKPSAANRRWVLAGGAVLFIALAVSAYLNLPERSEPTDLRLLLLVAATLTPLSILLSGAEFAATGRLIGQRIPPAEAVRISVVSSAANLLPIPGSFLVRTRALKTGGASGRAAVGSPIGVGLAWMGSAGVIGGLWLLHENADGFSVVVLGSGIVAVVASLILFRVLHGTIVWPVVASVYLIESAMVLVSAMRYLLVLRALGVDASFPQALALALSSVVGAAVGFVPGGLGLREALAGAFAPIVSLSAAAGVLSAVVNRIVGLIVLAIVALAIGAVDKARARTQ